MHHQPAVFQSSGSSRCTFKHCRYLHQCIACGQDVSMQLRWQSRLLSPQQLKAKTALVEHSELEQSLAHITLCISKERTYYVYTFDVCYHVTYCQARWPNHIMAHVPLTSIRRCYNTMHVYSRYTKLRSGGAIA